MHTTTERSCAVKMSYSPTTAVAFVAIRALYLRGHRRWRGRALDRFIRKTQEIPYLATTGVAEDEANTWIVTYNRVRHILTRVMIGLSFRLVRSHCISPCRSEMHF